MTAFGSDAVRQLMKDWRTVVLVVLSIVRDIKWEESNPSRASDRSPRVTLEKLREQEKLERQALANQVAVELGHRTVSEGALTDAKPGSAKPASIFGRLKSELGNRAIFKQ